MTESSVDLPSHGVAASDGPGSIQWLMLLIVLTLQTIYQVGMQAIAPLAPFIQNDLRISRAEIGLLGSAISLGALLLTLPSGSIADRVGSRPLLFVGPMGVGVSLILASNVDSFWPFAGWMFVVGIGVALTSTAATKAVVNWFIARTRGTAMGIKQTGGPLGAALGAAILPGIALANDWRFALALTGGLVCFAALLCGVAYHDYAPPGRSQMATSSIGIRAVLSNRNIQTSCLAGACFTAVQMILSTDLVLYLTEAVKMAPTTAGALLALAQMTGVAARLAMGVISDRLLGARRKSLIAFTGAGMIGVGLIIALAGDGMSELYLGALMVLVGLFAFGWAGLFLILSAELAYKNATGLTLAVALSSVNLGYFVGPPLFGYVVDVTHSYSLGWHLTTAIAIIGTAAMLRVRERPGANAKP